MPGLTKYEKETIILTNEADKIFEQLDKKLEEIKAFESKLLEALATDQEQ